MARTRRRWWLLVPALGLSGAFLLPPWDEFAFMGKESALNPLLDASGAYDLREWDSREAPSAVLRRLRSRLNGRTGWGEILLGSLSSSRLSRKGSPTDKNVVFGNMDTGGFVSFIAYDGEPSGRTCVVIASEPRIVSRRLRHLARRVFGR